MTSKLIKNVMHRGAITCAPNAALHQVIRLMQEAGVHAVVVTEGEKALGIISHIDVIRHYGENLSRLYAKDIMSTQLISVKPEDTLEKAINLMLKNKVRRLPVVEGEQVVGLVSTSDVLRDMLDSSLGFIT